MQRMTRMSVLILLCGLVWPVAAAAVGPTKDAAAERQAKQLLERSAVQGGLVVHLGCGHGHLTAALHAGDQYVVHGLDTNAGNVAEARRYIQSLGCYGPVSVDSFDGVHLPYSDGVVNLLVAEELGQVSKAEVIRVLAPRGVVCVRRGGEWQCRSKPRPDNIDEWTHYRHDATGNPVARDAVVGPPRRMQWIGNPRWARSHEHSASLNSLVSAGGRIFYIIDEGPLASIQLPAKYVLAARDAFSGVLLWKRPLKHWFNHLFPLKSGPARLTRRLVAVDEVVYTTLGINEPLSALDAATGKLLRTYEGTKTAEEILYANGTLVLVVNPDRRPVDYQQQDAHCWAERERASKRYGWDRSVDKLMALEAETGRVLWERPSKIVPLSLAADGRRVVYHDGDAVVCLEQATGKELWRSQVPRSRIIPTGWSPTMIIYQNVVLFSGRRRSLVALSANDGQRLWTCKLHPSGHYCPEDVLIVDGLVWSGDIASSAPRSTGTFTGRDPHTGEVKRQFRPNINPFAIMHQRCYPSKATQRYLMPSWIGIEFIDPRAQTWQIHHWVRGGCFHGIVPCNGLIYVTPHSCACYYQSKLRGLCALAPAAPSGGGGPVSGQRGLESAVGDGSRLERGPAYDAGRAEAKADGSGRQARTQEPTAKHTRQLKSDTSQFSISNSSSSPQPSTLDPQPSDWPTWRHDAARSGFTRTPVSSQLKQGWQRMPGGRLSSLTAADGKLFVARIDQHTVCALDATTGKLLWSFVAGGRVDSPPTYYQGSLLFGSADGWVYCLRASDGQLAWRFRVAPADRRIVAFNQVESVWPLHGSVLVQDGVAWCVAGRSMFLDGGLRLVRLDPRTGRKLSETILDDRDPRTGKNLQSLINHKKMPVALPDVLSSDGQYVYMRSQRFDLHGKRVKIAPEPEHDQQGNRHVFSPVGLLDDTWFHRAYWVYGKNVGEGWSEWFQAARLVPYGRILCVDDETVYAYGRHPWYLCNSSVLEYRLYAADKSSGSGQAGPTKLAKGQTKRRSKIPRDYTDWKSRSRFPMAMLTKVRFKWVDEQPAVMARAMVLADKTLFVAGPPDLEDERQEWGKHLDPKVAASHREQAAALEGKKGGLLWAVSATDGKKLAECRLPSPPVFDGLIAAAGRLYLATMDGRVMCMEPQQE